MRIFYIHFVISVLFFIGFNPNSEQNQVPDSSLIKNTKLNVSLSASMHRAFNWNGINTDSWSLSSEIDYTFIRKNTKNESLLFLNSDLGYTGFTDSIWYKNADRLNAEYLYKKAHKHLSRTISARFTTGILNDYEFSFNPLTGKSVRYQTGNILSPATLESGFGVGYSFPGISVINLSLSTARLKSIPTKRINESSEGILITKFMDGKLMFDYGFTLSYIFAKELNRHTTLKSTGKLFIKNFHRDAIEYDADLHFTFRISRLIQLKSLMSINYDPLVTHKMQLRYEITTGIYYSNDP